MHRNDILHRDFQLKPWWWEDYEPQALAPVDVPATATVVIVGAGYAGLSAALELNKQGVDAVVIEAEQPGFGGSTRNGG